MGAKKAQPKNAGGQGGNAPKGGKGGKGAKAAMKNTQAEATDAAPKLKGCQKIKFKHILVRRNTSPRRANPRWCKCGTLITVDAKCAKHGKHIEADAKLKELNAGSRAYVSNFEKIAAEYSEDNAKLGEPFPSLRIYRRNCIAY